jgi:hypothetical protein
MTAAHDSPGFDSEIVGRDGPPNQSGTTFN